MSICVRACSRYGLKKGNPDINHANETHWLSMVFSRLCMDHSGVEGQCHSLGDLYGIETKRNQSLYVDADNTHVLWSFPLASIFSATLSELSHCHQHGTFGQRVILQNSLPVIASPPWPYKYLIFLQTPSFFSLSSSILTNTHKVRLPKLPQRLLYPLSYLTSIIYLLSNT